MRCRLKGLQIFSLSLLKLIEEENLEGGVDWKDMWVIVLLNQIWLLNGISLGLLVISLFPMNVLFWNYHRIGNANSYRALRQLCFSHCPAFIYFAKPLVPFESVPSSYWSSIGFSFVLANVNSDGLPIMWLLSSSLVSDVQIMVVQINML